MFKKSIAIAVPTLAAATLVAAGLGGGASQASDNDRLPGPAASAKKAVQITKCDGGTQKASWDRGVSDWVYAYADDGHTDVPGATFSFKGPKKGKDVLSVNLSAGTYLSGGYGQVRVLLDGVPMRPSDNVGGSYFYDQAGSYGTIARNYCRKVGKGTHTLRVSFRSNASSGHYFSLQDAMLHAEQSD